MIKILLEILKRIFEFIISALRKILGGKEDPPIEPEKGPFYWIIEKYGALQPLYFPDTKYNNALALWMVDEGVIDHEIYLPGLTKNNEFKTNKQGGIIFDRVVKDVTINSADTIVGFRKKLEAGKQANGGSAVEFVDPRGSVVQAEIMELLGVITEDGFLEEDL